MNTTFSQKDMVSFGNYVMSLIEKGMKLPEPDGTYSVTHADTENWKVGEDSKKIESVDSPIMRFINDHNFGNTGKAGFDLRVWASLGNMYATGFEIRCRKTKEIASFKVHYIDVSGEAMKAVKIEHKGTLKQGSGEESLYS